MKKHIILILVTVLAALFLCGAADGGHPYGTWTSTELTYYDEAACEYISEPSVDYSLHLYENGSFDAVLMEGELSGTWELTELREDQEGQPTTAFYTLCPDDSDRSYTLQTANERLYLYNKGDCSYQMRQMDEQELARFEKAIESRGTVVLGEWRSITYRVNDFSASDIPVSTGVSTSDYSVNFDANGTVRAVLDQEYVGIWETESVNLEDDGKLLYSYVLSFDGIDWDSDVYCQLVADENSLEELSISFRPKDISSEQLYTFRQADEAAQEGYAAEESLIVGSWVPVEAQWYSLETGESGPAEIDPDMFIEAFEDGSFKGCFPEPFEGTWIYEGANGRGDPQFCLNTGDGISSFHNIHEGKLVGYYTDAGRSIGVYMEKVSP